MSLRITDNDDGLESGALTSTSLLLDGLDLQLKKLSVSKFLNPFAICSARVCGYPAHLHNLILQLWQEEIHDLVLFDWQRVQIDLLHRLDLAILHETTQLGYWLPFLLLVLVCATTRSTSSTATASVSSTITSRSESTTTSAVLWCVSHVESN